MLIGWPASAGSCPDISHFIGVWFKYKDMWLPNCLGRYINKCWIGMELMTVRALSHHKSGFDGGLMKTGLLFVFELNIIWLSCVT